MTTGIDFEKLVKSIYEEMLSQESIENIEVLHNTSIQGVSGQKHQLDVYWSFKIAGVAHRVAVECKEYSKTIALGKIRDFSAALDDIGNISGIFVTTQGFQSGAVKFAQHKGIALKTIANPTRDDIKVHGGVSSIVIRANALMVTRVKESFKFDLEWAFSNTDLRYNDAVIISGHSDQIRIEDSNGALIATLMDLINQLPRKPENSKNLTHEFKYEDAYLIAPECKYPKLKIHAAAFDYDTHTETSESQINYEILAEKILRDYITGEAYLFGKTLIPKHL